jgi:hypothetical protein
VSRKYDDKRLTATVDIDTYGKLQYICERKGISLSELLREALTLRYVMPMRIIILWRV